MPPLTVPGASAIPALCMGSRTLPAQDFSGKAIGLQGLWTPA